MSDQSRERVSQDGIPIREVWRVCVDEFGYVRAPLAFVIGLFALASAPELWTDRDAEQLRLDEFNGEVDR